MLNDAQTIIICAGIGFGVGIGIGAFFKIIFKEHSHLIILSFGAAGYIIGFGIGVLLAVV
jgi:hypothetical protein